MASQITTGAAILAGGQSRRLGTNKALLRLRADGPTIIELVVTRIMDSGIESPLLITNTPDEYAFLGLKTLPDDIPGAGPLGGIVTALSHSPHDRVLVVGCDLPFLSPALLRYMATLPNRGAAIVPRWHDYAGQERLEPLHSIYSKSCIEAIRKEIASGNLKLTDFLQTIRTTFIDESTLKRYDPDLSSFCNINTPEELARVRDDGRRTTDD
jgi:molybdopterin-guanine dinucleotide biosynthesis protein A